MSKSFLRPESRSVGFVYEAQIKPGRLHNAHAGLIIADGDKPPCIVVNHEIESVIVARWPGRLWYVEIIQTAAEQSNLSTRLTLAVSVKVIEELPVSLLFGPHGEGVCRILESAAKLDANDIDLLVSSLSQSALDAYDKAWSCWETELDNASIENDLRTMVGGGRDWCSPVGYAFSVLDTILRDRAKALVGDNAFIVDEDGTEYFTPLWESVSWAFLCGAMGVGAPELVTPSEVNTLRSAWRNVYEKST
jgi:hypothetical protein